VSIGRRRKLVGKDGERGDCQPECKSPPLAAERWKTPKTLAHVAYGHRTNRVSILACFKLKGKSFGSKNYYKVRETVRRWW
jgi:hypothetical protein